MGTDAIEANTAFKMDPNELASRVSEMGDDQLAQTQHNLIVAPSPISRPEPDTDPFLAFGHAIASKPGDDSNASDHAFGEDDYNAYVAGRQLRLQIVADEIARRGKKFALTDKGMTLVDAAEPLDASVDTGHYDDSHAFGWNKKPDDPPPPVDEETGEVGPAFGWKSDAAKREQPSSSAPGDPEGPADEPWQRPGAWGGVTNPNLASKDLVDPQGAAAMAAFDANVRPLVTFEPDDAPATPVEQPWLGPGRDPRDPTPRKVPPPQDPLDTGHYDDGHAFGWNTARPDAKTASPISALPKPALAVGAAVVLVLAIGGFALANRGATVSDTAATAPRATVAATNAAPSAPAATTPTPAAALVTCSLVTTQEAGAILSGASVTAQGTTPPGPQCRYVPSQRVVWSFQEPSRTAQIRLDNVVITVYSGPQAASQFAAKQASYGKNSDDEQVSGLGGQAIYTGGQQLSVLRGTSYVNVSAQVDYDWGDGNTRYEDVRTKYVSILSDFAKDALARMP